MPFAIIAAALAGVTATTEDGRRVTLHDDGTWEPLAPAASAACAELVTAAQDPATGRALTASIEPFRLSTTKVTGLTFTLHADPESRILTWSVSPWGLSQPCIKDDNTLELQFTDGGRLVLENGLPQNCDGAFAVALTHSHHALAALAARDLQSLRLTTRDSAVEEAVPPDQAARIRQTVACLGE